MLEIKYLSTSLHFQAKMITKSQFEVMAFSGYSTITDTIQQKK